MKVAILGGAGFIGSNLTDKLLEQGHKVFVVDDYTTGKRSNLQVNNNLLRGHFSINEYDLLDRIFKSFRPEVVVHAVASYKNPDDWESDVDTNILGGINIIRLSQRYKVKKLIYFQTALCYGLNPDINPIPIDYPLLSGGSSYAISKTAFEHYLEISGLRYTTFRLANIYGRRNLSGAVPTFFNRIMNREKCVVIDARRDFVYIDDMLKVVIKSIEGKGRKKSYHISSGKDYSILDMYDSIKTLLGRETETEIRKPDKGDTKTIWLDNTQTKKDFDWDVSTPLHEGLVETINWYKENSFNETYTHLKI